MSVVNLVESPVAGDLPGAAPAPRFRDGAGSVVPAATATFAANALAACGGGGGGGGSDTTSTVPSPTPPPSPISPAPAPPAPAPAAIAPTAAEASRFLAQASMGADTAQIQSVQSLGYSGWLDAQLSMPVSGARWDWLVAHGYSNAAYKNSEAGFDAAAWSKLLSAPDTLRQRITLALSEIFVVGIDGLVGGGWRQFSAAAYLDLLDANAFGNHRSMLQQISLSAPMGQFLTFRGSAKANPTSGALPDENYARELMQLFTIGLVQLNPDGTPVLTNGQPTYTYSQGDVTGLARVFTGWDFDLSTSDASTPDFLRRPMAQVANRYETGTKTFLGTTVAAGTDATSSLTQALDAIATHANAAPFFAHQLIQRLVTSNPSADYVARVASAFANNGSGVRGDMKTVIKTVLLDAEARSASSAASASFGKLREPILRFTGWARAYGVASASGAWAIGDTSDPGSRLGQSPLRSASVFNFFRPGYVPPNTAFAASALVAPEFQIANESSVVGYLNYLQRAVAGQGLGDVLADYTALLALADDGSSLLAQINLVLAASRLSATTLTPLVAAVQTMPSGTDATRRNRIYAALLLVLAAPEFIVQKWKPAHDAKDVAPITAGRAPGSQAGPHPCGGSADVRVRRGAPMTQNASRRAFMKRAGALSIAGSAAPWVLNLAALGEAAAATATDYKALVCVFLYGGNDYANTLIPYDNANYAAYQAMRPPLAYAQSALAATALTPNLALPSGRQYALAPELASLLPHFSAGQLGVMLNVGTLVQPTTKAQYTAASVPLPPKLFSHNDQQSVWQSSAPEGAASGWGGRMGDLFVAGNGNATFTCVNVSGNAVFLSGKTAVQYQVTSSGPVALTGVNSALFGSTSCSTALKNLVTQARTDVFESEYNRVMSRSLDAGSQLSAALASAPAIMTVFPSGNALASQLQLVARMISNASAIGAKRQVFFVSIGGFDTHSSLNAIHPGLLTTLADAMSAFYKATVELGVANRVTTFTASDFGRTATGSDGSDHGWGSMHFMLGGAVAGGRFYGTAPAVANNGPDDVGQGRLLPSTSVDQYAATLGKWFGISDADLLTVLPNLVNWNASQRNLGFV